eukprot:TRINITY_DN245_c0_g1_i2.p2 TRINITY_DN245_c0_g1~~TRINITY_DN245_c0_g1_i2.p2  ORF type:complete len:253 (-),score=75.91 TRINITY_DN245_c0_g1_i2:72-830(-)
MGMGMGMQTPGMGMGMGMPNSGMGMTPGMGMGMQTPGMGMGMGMPNSGMGMTPGMGMPTPGMTPGMAMPGAPGGVVYQQTTVTVKSSGPGSFGVPGTGSPLEFVNSGRQVFIQSALGPFYMHLHGGNAFDGAKVTLWSDSLHQSNLRWTIQSSNDGNFYLCSAVNQDFVVHQHGANYVNGGEVTVWNKATHGHQPNLKVNFQQSPDGFWLIKFAHSGKFAHVHGGIPSNGCPITQFDFADQPNFKWKFLPAM